MRQRPFATLMISILMLFGTTFLLFGQSVATGELFSVERGSVEFFNYEGPHDVIESDSQIRGIGRSLAGGDTAPYGGKYRLTHLPPRDDSALGADILEILAGARVDHIDNVRRIISGYVADRYGYDQTEADTIAIFTTFYNAVYRADMEYLSGVYSEELISRIDPEKVGIPTSYREWAGNSQLLIPLSLDGKGEVRISADTVGDEAVVEEIRQEEGDRGTDERKTMVELREEQLEDDQKSLADQEKAVEEQKEELQKQEEEIARKEEDLQKEKESVEQALEEAPEGSDEQRALQEEQEAIEEKQQQLEEEKAAVEDKKEEVAKDETAVEEKQKELDEREAGVDQEREQIARDEQEAIAEREAAATPDGDKARFAFMRVREDRGVLLSTLMLLSSRDGSEVKRSGINTIRGRRVYPVDGGYVAVAGLDEPPQRVNLIRLDEEELSVSAESSQKVYGESWVLVHEKAVYAVVSLDNSWKIGRFNAADLAMTASSSAFIDPNTIMEAAAGALVVQDRNGSLLRLDPETLKALE